MTDTDALVGRLRAAADDRDMVAANTFLQAADTIAALKAESKAAGELADALSATVEEKTARIAALETEVRGWRECALYDPTVPEPTFKGWDRSALERMRKGDSR